MNALQKRKPSLGLVLLVFYTITSIGAMLLGMVQPTLGVPEVVIQLTQFGPTLGLITILLLWKREKRQALTIDLRLWPVKPSTFIVAVMLIAGSFAVAWLWYVITGHSVTYTSPSSLSHPFWLIVIAQFIGAAGEEIGWRCFLQPTLQKRMGVFPASVTVGFLWGIWHVGIFAEGWVYASFFVLFSISLSVILGELLRESGGAKLVLATTYHTLTNLGLLLWFDEEDGSRLAMGTLAVSCAIAAVIVMAIGRRNRASRRATRGTVSFSNV